MGDTTTYKEPWYPPEKMTPLFREKLLFHVFNFSLLPQGLTQNCEWCILFAIELSTSDAKLPTAHRQQLRSLSVLHELFTAPRPFFPKSLAARATAMCSRA